MSDAGQSGNHAVIVLNLWVLITPNILRSLRVFWLARYIRTSLNFMLQNLCDLYYM